MTKEFVHPLQIPWYTITEFPDYEINKRGDIRNKMTGSFLPTYTGRDYENIKSVYMWRNGERVCRGVMSLLRTAYEVTDIGLEQKEQ